MSADTYRPIPFHKGKALDAIFDDPTLSATARLLACYLVRRANSSGKSWPSLDTMQREMRVARGTLVKGIGELEAHEGAVRLDVQRRCALTGPGRAPNVYGLKLGQSSNQELRTSGSRVQTANSGRSEAESKGRTLVGDDSSSNRALSSPAGSEDLSSNGHGPESNPPPDLSPIQVREPSQRNLLTEPTQTNGAARDPGEHDPRAVRNGGKGPPEPLELVPSETRTAKQRKLTSATQRDIELVFAAWLAVVVPFMFARAVELTPGRRKAITNALGFGLTVADLELAIHGARKSTWHCGDNPDGKKYLELRTILKNREAIDNHIAHATSAAPPRPRVNGQPQRSQPGELEEHRATRALLRANERNGVIQP